MTTGRPAADGPQTRRRAGPCCGPARRSRSGTNMPARWCLTGLEPSTCCLGDNCQSSAQTAPVGSGQLRLGRHSAECGLVGYSRVWWNDRENDHRRKLQRRLRVAASADPEESDRSTSGRCQWLTSLWLRVRYPSLAETWSMRAWTTEWLRPRPGNAERVLIGKCARRCVATTAEDTA
jgi:hypothetical protein